MVVHKPSLMSMPFKSLSARMLSMFIAQFSLMLRLLAIAMTFTTDTFGCERLISLVNDLQTVLQSRMEHDCLCSQMWWSTEMHGPHTWNGKRPCRGWIAVGTSIVDTNVTTMHRRQLLKPLRQRQVLDAPLSIQALRAEKWLICGPLRNVYMYFK